MIKEFEVESDYKIIIVENSILLLTFVQIT